eukprot:307502_1
MAEEKCTKIESLNGNCVWLLIRGSTKCPSSIKVAKRVRAKPNGNYLSGMVMDMTNMEKHVMRSAQKGNDDMLYNTIQDMLFLKKNYVLQTIQQLCKDAKANGALKIAIYYTGHGQAGTGNWCFSDGVVALKEVINIIIKYWKNNSVLIMADCCYSGNWALSLRDFDGKVWEVQVKAASWPGCVAYDDADKGGYWTQYQLDQPVNKKYKDFCVGDVDYNFRYCLKYYSNEQMVKKTEKRKIKYTCMVTAK